MAFNLEEDEAPATMNPHLQKQGEAGRANLGYVDSDYPPLGVMDTGYDKWKTTQNRLEEVGVGVDALSALPMVGGPRTIGKAVGELANEVLTPKVGRRAVSGVVKLSEATKKDLLADIKDSPVHKEYEDGMKWIQLTKPGQFSRESDVMGHSVRGYEPTKEHPDWNKASGEAGKEEYGAGGWEAIKRGDAKVYSLRDPKGVSHVTVEVEAAKPTLPPFEWFDELATNEEREGLRRENPVTSAKHMGTTWDKALRDSEDYQDYLYRNAKENEKLPPRITQIKGKQNTTPVSTYIPYVQDFVKEGKWAGVGDLENTGLVDLDAENRGPGGDGQPSFYKMRGDAAKNFFGQRYVKQEAWDQFEKGSRDPGLKGKGMATPEMLAATAGGTLAATSALNAGGQEAPWLKYKREDLTSSKAPEGPWNKYKREDLVAAPEDHSEGVSADYTPKESQKSMLERIGDSRFMKGAAKIGGDLLTGMAIPAQEYEHLADKAGGAVVDKTGSPALGAATKTLIEAPPLGGIGRAAGEGAGLVGSALRGGIRRITGAPQRELAKKAMSSMREDLLQSAGGAEQAHGLEEAAAKNTLAEIEAKAPSESWGPKAPKRLQTKTPQGGAPKVDEKLAATSDQIKENIRRGDLLAQGTSTKSQTEALNIYKNTITKARDSGMLSTQQYDSAMMDIDKIQSLQEKTKTARRVAIAITAIAGVGYGGRHLLSEVIP